MSQDELKRIPIKDLLSEEGADELLDSPEMQPYMQLAMAAMQGADHAAELEAIRQLPIDKRYVWRVASALKWGFADFDNVNVNADRETMSPEDFAKVVDLLKHRPIQFCIFLKALLGEKAMVHMMVQAINTAKQVP